MACRLVSRQQEKNKSKSNRLQKESSGAKGVGGGVSPRREKKVKREVERGGKVMKRKEGRAKGEEGVENTPEFRPYLWMPTKLKQGNGVDGKLGDHPGSFRSLEES